MYVLFFWFDLNHFTIFFYTLQILNQSILNIDDTEMYTIMEESNSIERDYHAFFDNTIANEEMSRTFAM